MNTEAFDHRLQSGALEPQTRSRTIVAGQDAIGFTQNAKDMLPLHVGEVVLRGVSGLAKFSRWGGKNRTFAHDHHPLDHILEFADVPRPVPAAQNAHGVFRDTIDGPAHAGRVF